MEVGGEEKTLKIFHGNACYAGYKCATLVIHISQSFKKLVTLRFTNRKFKVRNVAIYKAQR